MKLSKVQTIILVVIAVAILGGFGWVSFQDSSRKKSKLPDPGAEIRKKYKDTKTKEEVNPKDQAKVGEKKASEKKNNFVTDKDETGEVGTALPIGGTLTEEKPPEAPMPTIRTEKEGPGRTIVGPEQKTDVSGAPAIPTNLFQARPPEDPQTSTRPTIPPKIKTRPGRYLFNNYTEDAIRGNSIVYQSQAPNYSLDSFAPMGEWIDIALMHNAATIDTEIPVTAAVWTPFYFQGHLLLNTGEKLIGRGTKGRQDRMKVVFDRVIFKTGKSMSIQAIAVDVDGSVGVKGYMVGDLLLQQLGIIASDAVSSFMEGLMDKEEYMSENGTKATSQKGSLQNALTQATKKATTKVQEIVQGEIEENKPYVLVPAGTRARAYLLSPVDVSVADYGK
ncbi:MAG: TrbI/VirB10 family protein [Verrucomicrobiota bacterium]